jgi:2-C-methyl-D-erythritol 2,4-cyclodiphosphate synthase
MTESGGKSRHRVVVHGLSPRKPATSEQPTPEKSPSGSTPFRIGHGYDIHKLQPGGKLILGGVTVSDQFSAIAHSDGDVVIHALVDAILGAIGWGDIGELFPNSDPQWKGAASRVFLETVVARLRDANMRVINADITILAEQPKLAPFKAQIRLTLREMLGRTCLVNIKAGTNEGCDAVGRGEAIAAHAVVLLAAEA